MKTRLFLALMLAASAAGAADTSDENPGETTTQTQPDGVTVKREAGGVFFF